MRTLLLICFILMSFVGYSQYPIKTIFKGDSVIILTIEQSNKINSMIDKKVAEAREIKKRELKLKVANDSLTELNRLLTENNDKLKQLASQQNQLIDSIYGFLIDTNFNEQHVLDSLWFWALGPSLIYTQYPDDSTIYVMDLSEYYLAYSDDGFQLTKMSKKQYKNYKKFIETYGVNQMAWFEFRSKIKIHTLGSQDYTNRKIKKYKTRWRYKK